MTNPPKNMSEHGTPTGRRSPISPWILGVLKNVPLSRWSRIYAIEQQIHIFWAITYAVEPPATYGIKPPVGGEHSSNPRLANVYRDGKEMIAEWILLNNISVHHALDADTVFDEYGSFVGETIQARKERLWKAQLADGFTKLFLVFLGLGFVADQGIKGWGSVVKLFFQL
ncbi:MAG: hypothetical protein MPL62_08565 [Alphaproteobacteria bacterium]|nr:hypothetical protein [Alphaproteobacteria bacterium]